MLTQRHELGTVIECNDGSTRKYFKANAAVAQYDALIWDTSAAINVVIPSAAADIPIVGIAPIAVTTQYYFWAIVGGKANVKVAAAVTAGAALVRLPLLGLWMTLLPVLPTRWLMAAGSVLLHHRRHPSAGIALVYVSG